MADKEARALNLLGADRDIFDSTDAAALLEIIDEYFDYPQGIATPATQPFNYTASKKTSSLNNNKLHIELHNL